MKNLFKSLSEFQSEVPVIYKGETAGQGSFAYKYADLPAIMDVINPLLKKHGLGFTQLINHKDGVDYLVFILFHESGETLESQMRLLTDVELKGQNLFQSYGSMLTYFRRYQISAILRLVTDKDTDAQGETIKKKTFPQDRFQNGLDKVTKGELTKEAFTKALEGYELTDVQSKALLLL
jgi:hypothetical protein